MLASYGSVAGQGGLFKGVVYDISLTNPNVLSLPIGHVSYNGNVSVGSRIDSNKRLEAYCSNLGETVDGIFGGGTIGAYINLISLNVVGGTVVRYRMNASISTNYNLRIEYTDGTNYIILNYFDVGDTSLLQHNVPVGKTLKGICATTYVSTSKNTSEGTTWISSDSQRLRMNYLEII